MAAAVEEEDVGTAMVGAIQTFSDSLKWNPHLHGLAPRGGWSSSGEWVPVPYIDPKAAELLFRHKVLRLLKDFGLVSNERIQLLLSWERTGFCVHNTTTVYPSAEAGLQRGCPVPGWQGALGCHRRTAGRGDLIARNVWLHGWVPDYADVDEVDVSSKDLDLPPEVVGLSALGVEGGQDYHGRDHGSFVDVLGH